MVLAIRATGQAAPRVAWDRYVDLRCWPQWAPHIRRVDGPTQVVRPGDHGAVIGPVHARVHFTILDVDHDNRRWSWRIDLAEVRVTLDHGIDTPGSGTVAWVRIHAPALVVAPYAPLAWRALRRLVTE